MTWQSASARASPVSRSNGPWPDGGETAASARSGSDAAVSAVARSQEALPSMWGSSRTEAPSRRRVSVAEYANSRYSSTWSATSRTTVLPALSRQRRRRTGAPVIVSRDVSSVVGPCRGGGMTRSRWRSRWIGASYRYAKVWSSR